MTFKSYIFHLYANAFDFQWCDYEYYCSEIADGVRQPFFSERECFVAVLQQEGLIESGLDSIMTVDFLEQLLLSNNIYVQFINGE